jgi:hypothetical protein
MYASKQVFLSLGRKSFMEDKVSIYYIIAALFLVFSVFTIYQYRHTMINAPVAENAVSKSAGGPTAVNFLKKGEYPSFVSGVMEPGNIRLELSPEGFENDAFKVRFFANAHDLILGTYDLALMTTLEYENRLLKPLRSDRMKGHHDSGLMVFDLGILHNPDSLTTFSITVRGLPKEETRVFSWR